MQRHVSLPQINNTSVCTEREKERERERERRWWSQGLGGAESRVLGEGGDTYYNGVNTRV